MSNNTGSSKCGGLHVCSLVSVPSLVSAPTPPVTTPVTAPVTSPVWYITHPLHRAPPARHHVTNLAGAGPSGTHRRPQYPRHKFHLAGSPRVRVPGVPAGAGTAAGGKHLPHGGRLGGALPGVPPVTSARSDKGASAGVQERRRGAHQQERRRCTRSAGALAGGQRLRDLFAQTGSDPTNMWCVVCNLIYYLPKPACSDGVGACIRPVPWCAHFSHMHAGASFRYSGACYKAGRVIKRATHYSFWLKVPWYSPGLDLKRTAI